MSTISECKKLLKRYSIARIPFVVVDTIENARALSILKKNFRGTGNAVLCTQPF